ncbi:hypothetical protein FOXB_15857 [Fusarium oxysporum f. sp. conglutinans Fo5176]|uniref:Uncharacterized protein n=1 Tax=Fusarium oxysporum (strain Fo5176) TaxID=660025 RepID=F9GB24_FUSOF|nr:hypothetical protein FOXB_15857 [Fusarium oxysporum f. sp. conglutinans Fo5176]
MTTNSGLTARYILALQEDF